MNIREIELMWYRENGKYPDRVTTDSNGKKYVIGDDSWNGNPKNKNRQELVDPDMSFVL